MKPVDPNVDLEWVLERFAYEPETGRILHKVSRNSVKAGQEAGNLEVNGYIRVKVRQHKVLAHRLALFIVNGEWPAGQVDHKNRDRSDNRLANLRVVTSSINNHNRSLPRSNTSGAKGVQWRPHLGKWQAVIRINGHRKSLGHFLTFDDAAKVRRQAEQAVAVAAGEAA